MYIFCNLHFLLFQSLTPRHLGFPPRLKFWVLTLSTLTISIGAPSSFFWHKYVICGWSRRPELHKKCAVADLFQVLCHCFIYKQHWESDTVDLEHLWHYPAFCDIILDFLLYFINFGLKSPVWHYFGLAGRAKGCVTFIYYGRMSPMLGCLYREHHFIYSFGWKSPLLCGAFCRDININFICSRLEEPCMTYMTIALAIEEPCVTSLHLIWLEEPCLFWLEEPRVANTVT